MADPDLAMGGGGGGGGGPPDPERGGGGRSGLRASFWSKKKGGCGATPLDPPLMIQVRMQEFKFGGVQNCHGLKAIF